MGPMAGSWASLGVDVDARVWWRARGNVVKVRVRVAMGGPEARILVRYAVSLLGEHRLGRFARLRGTRRIRGTKEMNE